MYKIKKIYSQNYLANIITKILSNLALEKIISINKTIIKLERLIKQ